MKRQKGSFVIKREWYSEIFVLSRGLRKLKTVNLLWRRRKNEKKIDNLRKKEIEIVFAVNII